MIFKFELSNYKVVRVEVTGGFIELDMPGYPYDSVEGYELNKVTYTSILNSVLNSVFNQKCIIEEKSIHLPTKLTLYSSGDYRIQVGKTTSLRRVQVGFPCHI